MGKELERNIETSEALAVKEVESYIEKVEISTENSINDTKGSTGNQKPNIGDINSQATNFVSPVAGIAAKKNIVLPLSEKAVSDGLGGGMFMGVKWLSEWCVMMIKKYPGRVFYSSPASESYD